MNVLTQNDVVSEKSLILEEENSLSKREIICLFLMEKVFDVRCQSGLVCCFTLMMWPEILNEKNLFFYNLPRSLNFSHFFDHFPHKCVTLEYVFYVFWSDKEKKEKGNFFFFHSTKIM